MDIPSILSELDDAKSRLEPRLQALGVLQKLPLKPETASAVLALLVVYQRRERLIGRAIAALRDLMRDGYPTLPEATVIRLVYEDLLRNLRLAQEALKLFLLEDDPISKVEIIVGVPESKTAPEEPGLLIQ